MLSYRHFTLLALALFSTVLFVSVTTLNAIAVRSPDRDEAIKAAELKLISLRLRRAVLEFTNEADRQDAGATSTTVSPPTSEGGDNGTDSQIDTATVTSDSAGETSQDSATTEGAPDNTDNSDNTTTTTTTEVSPTSASSAFADFTLLLMEEVPVDASRAFRLVPVFGNGSFTGPFEGSPTTVDPATLQSMNDTAWYHELSVRDRIAFQFRYNSEATYEIVEPTVSVMPGAGLEPKVSDFETYLDSGSGTFTIQYACVLGKPGRYVITMTLPVTKEHAIETAWVKECGSGRFEPLEFGFVDHRNENIKFNPDGTYNALDEKKKLEVGPMDASTELFVKLDPPAENLDFLNPTVMSDAPEVKVELRGTVAAGRFSTDTVTSFNVLYHCISAGSANVKFTTGIPPWDNVTVTWSKDCGGTMSQALLIGTGGEESFDVMQEGELRPEYDITELTTLDNVDSRVKVIGPDAKSVTFYITNSDDTSDIYFQTISTTMSDPDVVATVVNKQSFLSLSASGGVVERDTSRTLTLFLVCRKKGKSLVLVTIPTIRYQNVEFGFIKECDGAPLVVSHSGFMRTADSMIAVILILAVLGAIGFCIYRARKGGSYKPVPTTETDA